jgi:hypothetical protein
MQEEQEDLTFEEALARSVEWRRKAREATTNVLKSVREAVARDYVILAAEIRRREFGSAHVWLVD